MNRSVSAFWHEYVYIGNTDAVTRYHYKPGQMKAEGSGGKDCRLAGKRLPRALDAKHSF